MGSKLTKIIAGTIIIGASFLIPGLSPVVAGLLLNTGVGLVSRAVFSPKLDQRQNAVELNTANNLAPLPVVYGRAKVGLRLVDMRASGDDLWIVGALCHAGQSGLGVSGIKEIYFNDQLAFDAAGNPQSPFIGGAPYYTNFAWVYKHRGENSQTADINLKAAFPNDWTDNDKGVGVAYVVFHLKWRREVYPTGIPNITCVVEGNQVFDPRDTLNKYSTNPALCLYDYLKSGRYGGAVTAFEVDESSFITEANYCDDLVSTPAKPTSSITILAATAATPCEVTTNVNHGWSTGNRVSIILGNNNAAPGLTGLLGNWTITVTAANKFTLDTSSTTGVYNANSCKVGRFLTQKRFECNGWLDSEQSPMDNIQELLNSCRGNLVYEGGKFRFFIRKPTTAQTLKLTEDNIIGGWNFATQGIKESPNQIRVRFLNADKNGAPDEVMWPRPGVSNTYLTQDNNFESTLDINLSMTTDRYTAEQIGMVILRESRSTITVELTANEEGLLYRCGDVVNVTHPTPGWTDKPFWVLGTIVIGASAVRLALMEYDVNAYSLDEQAMFPADPDTNLPNPLSNGPPTGVGVTASTVIGTDGTVVNTLTVAWTPPTTTLNPNLDHYELQYKLSTESLWRPAPNPLKDDVQAIIPGVGVGTWNIQLRSVNSFGAPSDWVAASVAISGGGGTGGSTPATPTGLAASFIGGNLEVVWNLNSEADVAGYEIREGASWAGGVFLDKVDAARFKLLKQYITKRSYTIRVKAVTRSGTYSTTEASVAVSQPIPDATQITAPDVVVQSRLGKLRMTVNLAGTGATQARLFASLTNGFTPATADIYAERSGLVNSTQAVFEFVLPISWFSQTIYCKIGLKDELSDQLAEAEQFSSQFSVVGKRVDFDNDVDDGTLFKRTLEIERNSTWKSGENLVANPSGEAGDYRNWKSLSAGSLSTSDSLSDPTSGLVMSVVSDPLLPAGVKAFELAGDGRTLVSAELIPVETALRYQLTTWARQAVTGGGTPRMYFGLAPYNKDGVRIMKQSVYHPGNFTTTLAAAVNPGDTTVTLTDATNFPDESGSGFNTYVALNVDVAGRTDLPNLQVLRYTSKSGNVLTLTSVVPAGISAANGSSVRFHRSGSNYIYNPMSNVNVPTGVFTEYTGAIEGEQTVTESQNDSNSTTKFWLGTRYVRILALVNSGATGGTNRQRISRTTFYQAVRDRDVKDVGASKLGSGTDLSLPSVIKESGGKTINRLLAKTLAGDVDTLDGVPEGTTYQRPLATGLTSGQIDMSKAGVINKLAQHILRTGGGATLQAIVAKVNDTGDPMRSMVPEGGVRPLVWERSHLVPNGEFEIWETSSQPHGWSVDTTAGATCAKETSTVLSGDASLKYSNPDNASASGWHGVSTNDLVKGAFCLPLRVGVRYRVSASARVSQYHGSPNPEKFRIRVVHDVGATLISEQEFIFKAANTWQSNKFIFEVPSGAGANSKMIVEFNRNGSSTSTDFFLDTLRVEEESVNDKEMMFRAIKAGHNIVVNGDFYEGQRWWQFDGGWGGTNWVAYPGNGYGIFDIVGGTYQKLTQMDALDDTSSAYGYLLIPLSAGDEVLIRAPVTTFGSAQAISVKLTLQQASTPFGLGPFTELIAVEENLGSSAQSKTLMGVVKITTDGWYTFQAALKHASAAITGSVQVGPIAAYVRPGRPKVKVYHNTTQTLTTAALTLAFNSEASTVADLYNAHDNSTNNSRLTVTWGTNAGAQGGKLVLRGQCTYQTSSSGNYRELKIVKNGSTVLGKVRGASETSLSTDFELTLQVFAVDDSYQQGDYYELVADGDNTGNITISGGESETWFRMDLEA